MPGPVSETAMTTQGPRFSARGERADVRVRGANRQLAAGRHCVPSVQCQVDDHLAELARISLDARHVRLEVDLDRDLLADQPVEEAHDARDRSVRIDDRRLQHLLATEREQLTRQQRRTIGGCDRLAEVVVRRLARVER